MRRNLTFIKVPSVCLNEVSSDTILDNNLNSSLIANKVLTSQQTVGASSLLVCIRMQLQVCDLIPISEVWDSDVGL